MSKFLCPVCGEKLCIIDKTMKCSNNHSFDISSKGYVNLLINTKNKNKTHGDDKEMVDARYKFLNCGFYQPLSDAICRISKKHLKKNSFIVDAGCGECYYTANLYNYLKESEINCEAVGIDISKHALMYASKRCKDLSLAVGSVFRMPLEDNVADLLLTVFSPYSESEYKRIIKKDGYMIMVFGLENHLYSLKKVVYDTPYKNAPADYELDGFELLETDELKYSISLDSNEQVKNLFAMTPYYHKTSFKDKQKLNKIEKLDTEIEFCVAIYKKL